MRGTFSIIPWVADVVQRGRHTLRRIEVEVVVTIAFGTTIVGAQSIGKLSVAAFMHEKVFRGSLARGKISRQEKRTGVC